MERKHFFLARDLTIMTLILIFAVLLGLYVRSQAGQPSFAEVSLHGELVARLPLDEDAELEVPGTAVVIQVKDGKAAFVFSDCPDQICVHAGWLSRAGASTACLPNGVALQIMAEEGEGLDAVVG